MSDHLSKDDVARLLAEPSSANRAELAAKVARQFDPETLTAAERRLAEDIIRMMAHDAVVRVRQSLAENLKSNPGLPREVALTLANDVEAVALPILSVSKVLTDEDLIELVRASNDEAKQAAIARRETVSGSVADALIENAGETAVAALVANEGAELAEPQLGRVVDRFGDSAVVQEPLVKRPKLPVTIAERLVAVVSDNLRSYLVTHHELSEEMASDVILRSRERATVTLLDGRNDQEALDRLVAQLSRSGRLTPSLLLRALCTGDVAFFETALSHMARVPLTNARLLIHDSGRLGLKSIYEKAKMPAALLTACRIALDVLHETPYDGEDRDVERHQRRVIERILTQYEEMASEDLEYLLGKMGDVINQGDPPSAAA